MKVGDRVTVDNVNIFASQCRFLIGQSGIIIEIGNDSKLPIDVQLDNSNLYPFAESELKKEE